MSILDKIKAGVGPKEARPEATETPVTEAGINADEKADVNQDINDAIDQSAPDQNASHGVQDIQAITLVWGKGSLAALLCLIWLLFLVQGFRISIFAVMLPYATSEWASHSLLTVVAIVADSMTSAVYIPMAKVLNVWGRAEGFLLMVVFATIGLILTAASHNLATFCAAQVFYSVGFGGMIYTVGVLAADASNLRNRGLTFAFTSSPYMITAFAGSKAAEAFLLNVKNWRWGFGCFAIILPVVTFPLYLVLKINLRKAVKQGIITHQKSDRTIPQKILYFFREFDIVGVFLFGGGLTVFLLPFTLASHAPNGWKSDYIIAMIIVGFIVLVLFGLWEYYWAPVPFLQGKFLTDRTVIGACLIDMTYQASYYCWNLYFTSFLQVVANLKPAEAGYVNSTFQIVSGILLFIVGYAIRRTGYFKWLFYPAIPLYLFAQGLMIHFRQPNQYIGYIVMCEIFISIAGSIFILNMQLAVLAAVEQEYIAAALATLYVSGGIGGAIGGAISGAIWTNTFLPALQRNLPEEAMANITMIYSMLPTQLSYPVNSPTRLAIQKSYGYAQTRMLTAGLVIMTLSAIWVFMLRNINVKKLTQTKGTVM
ncbi:mitochondrial phosphate carrier protein [Fusarium falciforme]